MNRRQLLVVVGCLVCLFAMTLAYPAADPRIDLPAPAVDDATSTGNADGSTVPGSWKSYGYEESKKEEKKKKGNKDNKQSKKQPKDDPAIALPTTPVPNKEVEVLVDHHRIDSTKMQVNGKSVDEEIYRSEEHGGKYQTEVTVPFAEQMTVTVGNEASRTFDIKTDASLVTDGVVAQNEEVEFRLESGYEGVSGVPVSVNGKSVGKTDEDGEILVPMPEKIGDVTVRADRGPVEATETVTLPEPEINIQSPVLIPGTYAPVKVTTNGVGVQDAKVSVEGGGTATTNDAGWTLVRIPVDEKITVESAAYGADVSATVGRLYLRLTLVFVVIPGVLLGMVYSYLRYMARADHRGSRPHSGISMTSILVDLADALSDLSGLVRLPRLSFRGFSLPSFPSLRVGASLPSLTALVPTVPEMSFSWSGSLVGGLLAGGYGDGSNDGDFSIRDRFGLTDDEQSTDDDSPSLAPEPLGPSEPGAEVRTLWHRFLDRVGLDRRETQTPGQAARRALAAGFPAHQVRRLLSVFRESEYADRELTPDHLRDAKTATESLLSHDPEEDDQ